MDDSADLPQSLRPPGVGSRTHVTWRADLGGNATVGHLAASLADLQTAIAVGERWGASFARESARRVLIRQVAREGPRVVLGAARSLGYRDRDLDWIEDWLHGPWGPRRFSAVDPWGVIETLADTQATKNLGTPTTVQQAEYRNPLEVVLTGSGFLILGCAYALRLVRDWSNTRRVGAGAAREAEAAARQAEARADLFAWLVDESMAGRMPVPPGELLNTVTHAESEAMRRLAASDITLELLAGLEPSGNDSA